jgi:hypothetical protein
MQNNEIKDWETRFDNTFQRTEVRMGNVYSTSGQELKSFISTLLSEHRNKVLEEAKGVVEEGIWADEAVVKQQECGEYNCYSRHAQNIILKDTLESIDKLKNK